VSASDHTVPAAGERRTGSERERPGVSPRVLVVDDSADSVAIVQAILRNRGFDVEAAADGPSALAMLEKRRPDVILLDVMMPAMSGMEVLDRIRANPQHAGIPVILVTAKSADEDLLEGYKFGADYYITKPFTPRQLLYGIGLVLGREFPV
jgi:two-component system response regulator ResD